MRLFSSFLITFLIPLVAVMPIQAELYPQAIPGQPSLLKIRLDDGSKTIVEANSVSSGYSVLVTDGAGKPVSDAAVAIHLPEEGASGVFANGEHAVVIYTDAAGVAKFPQVNWGPATGSLSFRVTAVKGELHAGTLIEQTVVAAGSQTPAARVAPFPSSQPASVKTAVPAVAPTPVPPPGVPVSVAAVMPQAVPPQAVPQQELPAPQTAPAAKPASADSVSVVNTSGSKGGGGISKKWVILGVVLAGVGLGAALALAGGKSSSSSSTAASTTTIGSPTINVGH